MVFKVDVPKKVDSQPCAGTHGRLNADKTWRLEAPSASRVRVSSAVELAGGSG